MEQGLGAPLRATCIPFSLALRGVSFPRWRAGNEDRQFVFKFCVQAMPNVLRPPTLWAEGDAQPDIRLREAVTGAAQTAALLATRVRAWSPILHPPASAGCSWVGFPATSLSGLFSFPTLPLRWPQQPASFRPPRPAAHTAMRMTLTHGFELSHSCSRLLSGSSCSFPAQESDGLSLTFRMLSLLSHPSSRDMFTSSPVTALFWLVVPHLCLCWDFL